ncbi:MAG: putative aminodeoxychorismate lyase [bacterium ADurb.Bin429]|nr:MAG: putative aminodeoxychorismate lyase [bacterium ADurb.Bin429]
MTDDFQGPVAGETETAEPQPRRRYWRVLLIVTLAVLLALGGAAGYVYRMLTIPVQMGEPQTVDILPRTTFRHVATRLQQRGLIPNAFIFRLYGRATGKAAQLKVGEYEVTTGMRPVDILDLLISGRTKAYWVTIPEGKWVSETGPFLSEHWPEAAADFPALTRDVTRWKAAFSFIEGPTLEGYLFPDTYKFSKAATGEQILTRMLATFRERCVAVYHARSPADGRSFHEVLVLASLVEAEAKVAAERPRIAGVYLNRLRRGMKLECDATVLYAKGERLKRVLYRDLEVNSPYNTYRFPGLPPGPICNPGYSAFEAAMHPEIHGYLYYVAKGDGSHVFTHTFAEHQAAIRAIRGK